jgi:hypothetical protein
MYELVGKSYISIMYPSVYFSSGSDSGPICPFDPRIFHYIGIGEGIPHLGIGKGL